MSLCGMWPFPRWWLNVGQVGQQAPSTAYSKEGQETEIKVQTGLCKSAVFVCSLPVRAGFLDEFRWAPHCRLTTLRCCVFPVYHRNPIAGNIVESQWELVQWSIPCSVYAFLEQINHSYQMRFFEKAFRIFLDNSEVLITIARLTCCSSTVLNAFGTCSLSMIFLKVHEFRLILPWQEKWLSFSRCLYNDAELQRPNHSIKSTNGVDGAWVGES